MNNNTTTNTNNNSNSNSNNNNISTPNFDNLFLHSLMGRLQLHHNHQQQQQPKSLNLNHNHNHTSLSKSFEELLLEAATSNNGEFSFSDYDDDDDEEVDFNDINGDFFKTHLSKEEKKLEKELIKVILSGKIETLKPNSGQAVSIGEHHVCVGFHEENGSEYRVWEWHGHIMLFDEENGYTPEYIYGNYFERLVGGKGRRERKEKEVAAAATKAKEEDDGGEQKVENLGLKELIDGGDAVGSRILHQSRNAGSPRCLKGTSGN